MSVCPHRRRRHRATGQTGQPRHPVAPPATRLHHAVLPPCGGVVRVATVSPVGALVVRRRVDCAGDMSAARERERAQLPRRFVALPPAISCERPTSHPLAATRLSYGSCTAGGPSWMTLLRVEYWPAMPRCKVTDVTRAAASWSSWTRLGGCGGNKANAQVASQSESVVGSE
jgi:hypothetical protein